MELFVFFLVVTFQVSYCLENQNVELSLLQEVELDFEDYKITNDNYINHLKAKIQTYEKKIAERSSLNYVTTGFSAIMDRHFDTDNGVVVFNKELIDLNGDITGYDPTLGIYTCPQTGVYYVSATLERESRDINAAIVVQGIRQVSLKDTRNDVGNQFNSVSNSVLAECSSGETIAVQATDRADVYGEKRISSFMAFKLYGSLPSKF